jgi:Trk K+ transport system NAD-binding subunit
MAEEPDQNSSDPAEEAAPAAPPVPSGDAAASQNLAEEIPQGGHVVICNWNSKAEAIIKELHSQVVHSKRLVVIVTDKKLPKRVGEAWRGVFVVDGCPLDQEFLLQAMVTKARSAIVLADPEHPNPDTANFMIAACIERLNPEVHTIVEVSESGYLEHFRGTGVDELICINEIAEKIISQSCLTHGLSELYLHLLTASEETNEIYIVPAPPAAHGRTYRDVRRAIGTYECESLILLGMLAEVDAAKPPPNCRAFRRYGKWMAMIINPPLHASPDCPFSQDFVIRPADELILMAYEEPQLQRFSLEPPGPV